jgi:EsV-like protein
MPAAKICKACGKAGAYYVRYRGAPIDTPEAERYCRKCSEDISMTGLLDMRQKYCVVCVEKCITTGTRPKQASYGGVKNKPLYCLGHKPDDMRKVCGGSKCEEPNCNTQPSFGFANSQQKRWCTSHKWDGAVYLVHQCEHQGCTTVPSYGFELGQTRWCFEHKAVGAINVTSRTCESSGCTRQAYFSLRGKKSLWWCSIHKIDDAVDIHKICEDLECDIRASYGFRGERMRWCKTHKATGAIYIQNRTCEQVGCDVQPSYGCAGGTTRWCQSHGPADKVVTRGPSCALCQQQGNLNFGDPDVFYCSKCVKGKISGASAIALEWLAFVANENGIVIHTALHSHGERRVQTEEKRYKVDGFCEETNTVYEFHGCLHHSCEMCYPDRTALNPISKRPHHIVWGETVRKRDAILAAGYNYVEIFECVWRKGRKALLGLT